MLSAPPSDLLATAAQQRMWLSDELADNRSANHVPLLYRASVSVDVPALQAALNRAVQRHEALRTRFVLGIDGLQQAPGVPAVAVDRPAASFSDEAVALNFLATVVREEFDLERGPLLRAAMADLDEGGQLVLIVFHHICIDDESLRIVLPEVWQDYDGVRTGLLTERAACGSYLEHAVRERLWLESPAASAQLEEMVADLGQYPGELPLPRPAGPVAAGGAEGVVLTAVLSGAEWAAVTQAARGFRSTIFAFMLAVNALLVHQISGLARFLLAIPVANRGTGERDLVGLFTNIVPIGVQIRTPESLDDLVSRVQDSVLDALDRRRVPFDRCAARLARPGHAEDFCNVSFGMGDEYEQEPVLGIRQVAWDGYAPVRYQLASYVTVHSDSATLSLFIDPRVIAREDAERWLARWVQLLRESVGGGLAR